jgi:hypothetical protein
MRESAHASTSPRLQVPKDRGELPHTKLASCPVCRPEWLLDAVLLAHAAIAPHIMEAFLKGRNATVFAFGGTGSGKTHSMFGKEVNARRPVPRGACRSRSPALALRQPRNTR